jgi:hypothetical protein
LAGNVTVKIFKDTATIPALQTQTTGNGSYKFGALEPGSYNVWAESSDSIVAYKDSIKVPEKVQVTADLTLAKGGSVTAVVGMQPGHNPASVTVNALGTEKYANVSDSGWFTIKGLAAGEYTLKLVSTIAGYTPTYETIIIQSAVADTLKDTIFMVFTDIPTVKGLKTVYDPFTGVVTVSWNKTSYSSHTIIGYTGTQ